MITLSKDRLIITNFTAKKCPSVVTKTIIFVKRKSCNQIIKTSKQNCLRHCEYFGGKRALLGRFHKINKFNTREARAIIQTHSIRNDINKARAAADKNNLIFHPKHVFS